MHKDKENEAKQLLQSLTDSQQNINKVLSNPYNCANFDSELFFTTLDKTKDLFFEIVEKCKYE